MAANRPMAVANNASEMPGATTASDELSCVPIWKKLFMIPQTVPNSPTKGATEPVVARKLSLSASSSASSATRLSIAPAIRWPAPGRAFPFLEPGLCHARCRNGFAPAPAGQAVEILCLPEIVLELPLRAFQPSNPQRERYDDHPHPDAGQDQPGHDRLDHHVGLHEQLERIEPRRCGGKERERSNHAVLLSMKVLNAVRQASGMRRGRPSGAIKPTRNVASLNSSPPSLGPLNARWSITQLAARRSVQRVSISTSSSSLAGRR